MIASGFAPQFPRDAVPMHEEMRALRAKRDEGAWLQLSADCHVCESARAKLRANHDTRMHCESKLNECGLFSRVSIHPRKRKQRSRQEHRCCCAVQPWSRLIAKKSPASSGADPLL